MKIFLTIALLLSCYITANATTYFVRNAGSDTNCLGTTDANYPGSGSGQPCAYQTIAKAVSVAVGGDVIQLAVQTFDVSTPIVLPTHSGASYVTIKGAEDAQVPAPTLIRQPMGAGVTAHMPIVRTTSSVGDGVFVATGGTGFWRINGVIISDNTTVGGVLYVQINSGSNYIFDRVVVKPSGYPITSPPYNTQARWGFQVNADNITIQDSDILGMYGLPPGASAGATAVDGNGIVMDASGSNLVIQRNYVEAWFDHVFLGGSDPTASTSTTVTGSPTLTTATVADASSISIGQVIAFQMPFDANECKNDNTHPCWGDALISGKSGNNLTFSTALQCNTSGGGARTPCTHNPNVPGFVGINGPQPTNVTIQQNHFYTPQAFSAWQLANNNNHPKAVTEVKSCNGLLFDGNYMDGFPSTFGTTSYNQAGGGPWTGNLNNTWSNNWSASSSVAFQAPLYDPYYLNTNGTNLTVTNNLWTGCDNTTLPDVSYNWVKTKGGTGTLFSHNSFICTIDFGTIISMEKNPTFYPLGTWTIRDNVAQWGRYGIVCDGGAFNGCFSSLTESKNLFYYGPGGAPDPTVASEFPNSASNPGTQTSLTGVKLVNSTTCQAGTLAGCALASDSPGHLAASDGADIGVNIATLTAALGGQDATTSSVSIKGPIAIKGNITIR